MASKRPTKAETRRQILLEVRASVRADILLDGFGLLEAPGVYPMPILDRVTRSIDKMIETPA